jgi:hypothetical protein
LATTTITNSLNKAGDTFPAEGIDPRDKGYEWILQFARAAWSNGKSYTPATMFYFGRSRMQEIYEYCMGKQSISKYKRVLLGDDQADKSWLNIDWTPPAFMSKFVDIAVSKILQREFEVEAFCVDPLAKSEEDDFFNQMKVKIMMRDAAQKAGSPLAQSPLLQAGPQEPKDLEQLQMQMKYGYKHEKAMESEIGISLIHQQNNIEEKRKRTVENLVKVGLGGYKEWIDPSGMVKFREVSPDRIITSYCVKNDFSDATHFGEVIYLSVADLSPYFNPEQLDFICKNVAGKYNNPGWPLQGSQARIWDRFKVAVLDIEFQSYNTTVYKKEIDGRGNLRTMKSHFNNLGNTDSIEFFKGAPEPKYLDVTREVWYKAKWLIDTDMMYDYGLLENMKRKQSSWWATSSSYHLYAWSFHDMMYAGLAEKLIPLEDKACQIWFKLQNLANKLIPYIINMDLNSFEGVNFGKGGANWTPAQAVDFLFQNFVAVYRSTDLLSKNPNYKPVTIEATGQLAVFGQYRDELLTTIDMMRQVTGLNEATDGSTIAQKTLNGATNAMMESTNNALYLISHADKQLYNSLNDAIVQRIQIAVKLGKVEGYAKALGSDTVKFYQISPEISNYELGIFTRPAPTYEERQAFYQDFNLKDSQGLIDPADKIIVMSCTNLKQAAELLAYNISKRKEEMHQQQMQLVQQQTEGNKEAALAQEQASQQTVALTHQLKMEEINTEKQWEYIIEQMKKQTDLQGDTIQGQAKIESNHVVAQAKIISQQIASQAQVAAAKAKPKPKAKKSA